MIRDVGNQKRDHMSFGLTPLIDNMNKLSMLSDKRKSKDDFNVPLRSNKLEISDRANAENQHGVVAKQLAEMFNADPEDQRTTLPCKS